MVKLEKGATTNSMVRSYDGHKEQKSTVKAAANAYTVKIGCFVYIFKGVLTTKKVKLPLGCTQTPMHVMIITALLFVTGQ